MRSSPRRSGAQELSEAIIASGLVKDSSLIHKIEKSEQNEEKEKIKQPKKTLLKGPPSFFDPQPTVKPDIKIPSIEEVIIDRKLNGPLPKLKAEGRLLHKRSISQQASFKNESSSIYPSMPDLPPPTKEQIAQLLPADKPITFPAVYFAEAALGKAGIATRENYEQLNNLLHTLTAEASTDVSLSTDQRLEKQKEAYDTVLTELVRQTFYECGAKGEILQSVRDFMINSVDQIPILRGRIDKQKRMIKKNLEEMKMQRREHEREMEDMENELSNLRISNQTLKEHANFFEQKIPSLETEHRNMRSLVAELRKNNDSLQEELKNAKEVADQANEKHNQAKDSLVVASNDLANLSKQFNDLRGKFAEQEVNSKTMENELKTKNEEIKKLTDLIKTMEEEDSKEDENISNAPFEERKEQEPKEVIRHIHKNAKKVDKHTQTSTKFQLKAKKSLKGFNDGNSSAAFVPGSISSERLKEFAKMKSDYQAVSSILGDNQISLEKWNEIRTLILKSNNIFQVNEENFADSSNGNFLLKEKQPRQCRLFASMIMSRVMDRVFRSNSSFKTVQVQADMDKANRKTFVTVDTQVNQGLISGIGAKDAFTKLLDPSYSERTPRTFEWTIKAVRSIFDEKTIRDSRDEDEGKPITSMPEFAFDWSKRQYGLLYLVHQCAWDLINSAREHQYKAIEISLFRQFIDMDLSTQQLSFFLKVRANVLRKGITCVVKTEEEQINYTCTFLASYQATDLVKSVLKKTGEEYVDESIKEVRKLFVKRPSQTLDDKTLYISLGNFLNICVKQFINYEKLELKKLINTTHLVPMPSSNDFTDAMLSLIQTLTQQEIADLHRGAVKYSRDCVDIDLDEFIKTFKRHSLLSKENIVPELEVTFDGNTKEYQRVKQRWDEMKNIFDKALERASLMKKTPSLVQATLTLETCMTNVCSSLTCYDSGGAQRGILSCTMALQNLMWEIDEPDPETIDQITQKINSIVLPSVTEGEN